MTQRKQKRTRITVRAVPEQTQDTARHPPQSSPGTEPDESNGPRWEEIVPAAFEGDENTGIFDIISDLEAQLDVAFEMKDAQEEEIARLRQRLAPLEEYAAGLETEISRLKTEMAAQEERNSALEFLENERLAASREIGALREELDRKSVTIDKLEGRIEVLASDVEVRDARLEELEQELTGLSEAEQSLRNDVIVLEQEKEALAARVESTNEELNNAIAERDKSRDEFEQAKQSLDDIRSTLSRTRAKAKARYYRKQT
jgi:chromosome segregation ATPase